jgi:hypothetical protein
MDSLFTLNDLATLYPHQSDLILSNFISGQ